MNRRQFIFSSAAATATCTVGALSLTGCDSSDIAALVQTLGNSASQLAAIEGNTALASKLLTDTGAAVAAIDNWKTGSIATEVIEALNIVEDDLQLFPITDQFAPLIDLAITTAESIIALLPPSTSASARVGIKPRRHVQLGYAAPKTASAYKKRFNSIVAAHSEWKVSKLA